MSESPELRFFRSNGGALHGLIKTLDQRQEHRRAGIAQIAKALGADQFHTMQHDGSFAGFTFSPEAASKLNKSNWVQLFGDYWMPTYRGNNVFWNALNSFGEGEVRENVVKFFGLDPMKCQVEGCPERGVWFVTVCSAHVPADWAMPLDWEEVSAFAFINERIDWAPETNEQNSDL